MKLSSTLLATDTLEMVRKMTWIFISTLTDSPSRQPALERYRPLFPARNRGGTRAVYLRGRP